MYERTCLQPNDDGFDSANFEFEFLEIPAVAYFSQKAYDYYDPPFIPPEDFEPFTTPFLLNLEGSFYKGQQGAIEFLLVGGAGTEDKAVMRIYGDPRGYKLFDGRIYFFRHVKNTHPPLPKERVDRIGVLGLTSGFQFGFFRQLDSLGAGYPDIEGAPPLDFQTFSSPFNCLREQRKDPQIYDFCDSELEEELLLGGMYYKELLIEAGSPTALAKPSAAPAKRLLP